MQLELIVVLKKAWWKLRPMLFPSQEPRNFLLSKLPQNSVGAEIGAWKGDFSSRILSKINPRKLYLIDPYRYVAEYGEALYGGRSGSQERMNEVYKSVVNRFRTEISNERLEIIRNSSRSALSNFQDNDLDWVYIDGDHTYEYVKKDLETSWSKVRIGGFITGDDYNLMGWWEDGVTKAVNEFIEQNRDSIGEVLFNGTQFLIEKRR